MKENQDYGYVVRSDRQPPAPEAVLSMKPFVGERDRLDGGRVKIIMCTVGVLLDRMFFAQIPRVYWIVDMVSIDCTSFSYNKGSVALSLLK